MLASSIRFAALLAVAIIAGETMAQSAANSYLSGIRASAVGTNYSVSSIINGNRLGSTAQAAGTGLGNFQVTNSSISSGVGRTPSTASIPTIPGVSSGGGRKPFTGLNRGSTVSPYLNLFNTGIGGTSSTIDNYNVLVRPQLNQQRTNRQLQLQAQQLNQRVQQISARPIADSRGSDQIMATGHSTVFGFYSRFYPTKNQRR